VPLIAGPIRRSDLRAAARPDKDGAWLTSCAFAIDDEFGTLKQGAALNAFLSIVAVLVILWLALRSPRIMLAVVLSLVVGLAATAACGLLMVGAFNLISVAFAALFIGIGLDFGIQLSVRYRSERHDHTKTSSRHSRAQPRRLGARWR